MNAPPGLIDWITDAAQAAGMDLRAWGIGWARAVPTVLLVPAFGLRAVALPVRLALMLVLAASTAPAIRPIPALLGPWPIVVLMEAAKGLPVALTAAVALWVASMAGGLVDNLRGARETALLPNVDSGATPTGALLSMLVAVAFLESGGPARVAEAIAVPELELLGPLTRAVFDLAAGIQLAVAVAAPVVVVAIVFELGGALMARAAAPALVQPLLSPLRSLAILLVLALLLDRLLHAVLLAIR